MYYMVVTSFKTRLDWLNNQFALPKQISFSNFVLAASTGNMLVWARNSLIVTSLSVVISTFLAVMAAFAVARMRFKGRQLYLNTLWVWNELLIALIFLQSNALKTLMPGISQFKGRFNDNEPLVLTGAFLSSLPMIVLYLAGQRFFVRGMVAGAVK